jgi:hypothetical protein
MRPDEWGPVKKMKLPIIKGEGPPDKVLSMDDYVKFVNFASSLFPGRRISKKDERAMRVDVPFTLYPDKT